MLQSQHIDHRVDSRLLLNHVLGGSQGPDRITIAIGRSDRQFDGLAKHAKHNRVFTRVVADTHGVIADFADAVVRRADLIDRAPDRSAP